MALALAPLPLQGTSVDVDSYNKHLAEGDWNASGDVKYHQVRRRRGRVMRGEVTRVQEMPVDFVCIPLPLLPAGRVV